MEHSELKPLLLFHLMRFVCLCLFVVAVPEALHAAPDGRPCKAEPTDETIQYGDLVTCASTPSGDSDAFRFAGSANDKIIIQLTRTSGTFDPCIQLFGPNGLPVGNACNNTFFPNSQRLDISLQQTGVHTIIVSDAGNDNSGTYTLALERLFPPSFGTPVRYGEGLNGANDPLGDVDLFLLSGKVGSRISIQVSRTGGTLVPCLQLYGPNGVLVPNATACSITFFPSSQRIEVTLAHDGTHTLVVSDADRSGQGTYSVSLQCLSAGCTDDVPTSLVAAVLPSSRSVQVGTPATAFATVINPTSATRIEGFSAATPSVDALACGIVQLTGVPTLFLFQATDPMTNLPIGTPNTPVTIVPGASQTFVVALTPTAGFCPVDVQFGFTCTNAGVGVAIIGLNTLLLTASPTPVPDIVALAATLNNDGIVNIPGAVGTGAFSVATSNVGASGIVTVSVDTGTATLPVSGMLCQTDPITGQCTSVIAPTLTVAINANATPTFAVFVIGSQTVPFDPASNRVFVRFKDNAAGCGVPVTRGATSVAVRTQ